MLIFALCVIAFFVGIIFCGWFFLSIVASIIYKITDGLTARYDAWTAKIDEPELPQKSVTNQEIVASIDVVTWMDRINFIVNFATEKSKELETQIMEREAERKRMKDNHDAAIKEEQKLRNTEGIPEEYPRNTEGIPEEYPRNTEGIPAVQPNHQGIPNNRNIFEESRKPSSRIWETNL